MVEEGFKLDAEQTAFGKHAAVALDAVAEVALCLFCRDDDGFAKESANFWHGDVDCLHKKVVTLHKGRVTTLGGKRQGD